MKKLIIAAVSAVAVAAPVVAVAAPAQAYGSPGCVTKAEFSQIKHGMSTDRVARIFGTKGTVTYSYIGTYVFSLDKEYKPCQPYTEWSMVEVDFSKNHRGDAWHVSGKSAYWIS